MPREARKNIESKYVHIIVQGIDKEFIFKDEKLKEIYKYLLKKNISENNIYILAYCIMDNHVHILMYCEKIDDISKIMQKINTAYAKIYNKIKNRVGYVFRDRFYTQEIRTEKQLYNCIAYIHNNPVKANMVKMLKEYKYSSYIEYKGEKNLITTKSINLIFGNNEKYIQEFDKLHERDAIEDIIDIVDNYKNSEEIIEDFVNKTGMTIEELKEKDEFAELLINLRHEGGLSLRDMSKIFNFNKDKLAKIINRYILKEPEKG